LKGGELGGEIREAEVKAGGSGVSITAIDILFRGSSRFDLEGKKLVIVEFT
jgi:hypothetical protein